MQMCQLLQTGHLLHFVCHLVKSSIELSSSSPSIEYRTWLGASIAIRLVVCLFVSSFLLLLLALALVLAWALLLDFGRSLDACGMAHDRSRREAGKTGNLQLELVSESGIQYFDNSKDSSAAAATTAALTFCSCRSPQSLPAPPRPTAHPRLQSALIVRYEL